MPTRRQTSGSAKRKQAKKKKSKKVTVHPEMSVMEIVSLHDDAAKVLAVYGLHCVGCAYNQLESLREGAEAHGLTDDDLSNLIEDLVELIASAPKRPQKIDITEAAANALLNIADTQGKRSWLLRVTSDDSGGFCMEFEEKKKTDDKMFGHQNVPNLTLIAAPETLMRIGGSTIDHREGRFKLDLMTSGECGCNEKECGCTRK